MGHIIEDKDPRFIIDPGTRAISTESKKIQLIQGDHNSERFTFEIPLEVEGHAMSACDAVEIHFINVDLQTKEQSSGVYVVDDRANDGGEKTYFTWLVSHQATKYVGSLSFLVKFLCYNEDGSVKYAWNTAIYKGISISSGIDNGEAVIEDYVDVLNTWKRTLEANQIVSIEQTQEGEGDQGENVWTATFGDGRTSELKVKNGSRGPTGLVGSIETVTGEPLHFFVGTRWQYNYELSDEIKNQKNLFALFTDELSPDEFMARVIELENAVNFLPVELTKEYSYLTKRGYYSISVLWENTMFSFGTIYWDGVHNTHGPKANAFMGLQINANGTLYLADVETGAVFDGTDSAKFYVAKVGGYTW